MKKTITIIIATFNAESTLRNCLDSIIPQLTEECELIIVDGNSSDSTNLIIDSYGDKVSVHISEPDKGIYDAWNKGVNRAQGEWIAFIGADDVLLPNAINKYLDCIHTTPDIDKFDYICANNEYVDDNGRILKIIGEAPEWSMMRRRMVAAHVASLHNKKNLFDTIGNYDLNFRICADYDLLLRKKQNLRYLYLNTRIARMKVGGMSFSIKALRETYQIRKKNKSVPNWLNHILYNRDVFAFKFFKFRKHVTGGASNLINVFISKLKGESYKIDDHIPFTYLVRLSWSKFISLIYGKIRFLTFKTVFVHPSSVIICPGKIKFKRNLNIGRNCYVNALAEIGLVCGENVSMGYQTHIELTGSLHLLGRGMIVGDNVGLGSHGHYGSGAGLLEIGADTIIGNYVSIHPENHNYSKLDAPIRLQGVNGKGVRIGRNCWIGAKVTILDGTVLGDGCIVAAGAVVKGVFPNNVIIGGVPAQIIKKR